MDESQDQPRQTTSPDGLGSCGIAEEVATVGLTRPLTVGEVAREVGLSAHTVRWYDRIGLLDRVPRDAAGHRRFDRADIAWLLMLIRLRATGMPVKDMIRYATLVRAGAGTEWERETLLESHRVQVTNHIAALQADLSIIEQKIQGYRRNRAATPTAHETAW